MDIILEREFEDITFSDLDLTGMDLKYKSFKECVFKKVDFTQCDMRGADFINCTFDSCNLSNSLFEGARLQGVFFKNSKLVGINFCICNTKLIFDISFHECNLLLCFFSDLSLNKKDFTASVFKECNFAGAKLRKSDFSGSDFKGSDFAGADLREADFRNAFNYNISPIDAKIKNAKFSVPEVYSMLNYFDIVVE